MAIAPCREKTHEMFLGYKKEFQAPWMTPLVQREPYTCKVLKIRDVSIDKAVEVAHNLVGCHPLDTICLHHSPPQELVSLQSA